MVQPAENVPLANLRSSLSNSGPANPSASEERDSLESFEAWGGRDFDEEPEHAALLPDAEKQSGVGKPKNGLAEDSEGLLESDDQTTPRLLSSTEDQHDDAAALVSKIVPLEDDPTTTTLSARVFVLGISLCILCASLSELFFFKSSAPSLSAFFIILAVLPLGKAMARYVPHHRVHLASWSFELNPGPFTVKEHLLTLILAGSGASAAYAGDIVAVQELYYHQDLGAVGGLLLLLTTQMLGFGLAGFVYNLLVRPTAMLWPATLTVVSLMHALHGEGPLTEKRLRLFAVASVGIFIWQFLPALVAPGLTSFAVLCIMNNRSPALRALGSAYTGFGVLNLSFDWSVIGSTGGLFTPFWASCNYFAGFAGSMYLLQPLLYFFNFWDSLAFGQPIGSQLYNSDYEQFNVSAVIKPDLSLDEAAWETNKPILLNPHFALTYGVSFGVLTSAITSVLLWNLKDIKEAFSSRSQSADPHVRLLERNYPLVPNKWYLWLGGVTSAASIYLVLVYPLQLPVWALFLANAISVVFLVPCGIIAATANVTIGLNVVTEFVAGFLLPGKPIANIVFKCFGYMSLAQALSLVGDLKLGLYMKIPPRHLFICQSLGTAIGSVVNYSLIKGVIASKRPYLDGTLPDPTGQWNARGPRIFYSASVIWGLLGPKRFFAGKYALLYLGFPLGVLLPLIPWYLYKKHPRLGKKLHLDKLSFPLILHAAIEPPQIPTNVIISGFLSAFASQYWAKRYHPRWFEDYNYVLSSALDAGTSLNALFIYAFGLAAWVGPSWWNSAQDTEHCMPGS